MGNGEVRSDVRQEKTGPSCQAAYWMQRKVHNLFVQARWWEGQKGSAQADWEFRTWTMLEREDMRK